MPEAGLTLKELFGGDELGSTLQPSIRSAVGRAQSLAGLNPVDLHPLADEAQRALASALDIRLGDILTSAWSTASKLREAADPARHKPDETVVVPMFEHTVRSTQEPVVEFIYNGRQVFSLSVTIELVLRLAGVVLRVRAGRVREIVSGTCTASATLSVAGVKLAERTTREIGLPVRVKLGSGNPILAARQPRTNQMLLTSRVDLMSRRIAAGLLDVAAVMLILGALTAASLLRPDEVLVTGILLWWMTQLLPIVIGATPGMLAMGLRLTDSNGGAVTLRELMFRPVMLLATIVTFRFRHSEGLLWHDRVSGTRVTNDPMVNAITDER